MSDNDIARRFLFDNTDIRGELVSLNDSFNAALEAHDYPDNVKSLLGELIAATVLLSSTLKFKSIMNLQAKGDGPLSLLMVECTDQKTFRALARWQEESQPSTHEGLSDLLGKGQLIITIDPHKGKRYQGTIPLEQHTLAGALNDYFMQSEQLPTQLWLAGDHSHCGGLLLQALPSDVEKDTQAREITWERVTALANTIKSEELLGLNQHTLLTRLFHQEAVRVLDEESVQFQCTCSRPRSEAIIRNLGAEEALAVVEEQGKIDMDCQFCNQHYIFTEQEVRDFFNPPQPQIH